MTPPRKTSFENFERHLAASRNFSDFPRIQLQRHQGTIRDDFQSLSVQERMELMEKLIVRVRNL